MSITGRAKRGSGCPLCGKTMEAAFKPFCSQGCRDRDLLNWLGDAYRVPGAPAGPDELAERLDIRPQRPL